MAEGVEPAELARAKAQLKAGMFMARESLQSRTEQAAGQVLLFGRLLATAEIAEQIDAVEAADLARLGASLLAPGKAAVSVLGPKAALKAADAFQKALFG